MTSANHELEQVFPMAVHAAIEGKRGFRHHGTVYSGLWVVTLAYNVAEALPDDLCERLRMPRNSSYSDGAKRLKRLLLKGRA